LITQRFTRSGRHDHKRVLARCQALNHLFLTGPEGVITEYVFENFRSGRDSEGILTKADKGKVATLADVGLAQ